MDSLPRETSLALRARIEFVSEAIARYGAKSVLDVGCGTGEFLTVPLAEKFPDVKFFGVDADGTSLDYARQKFKSLSNIEWSSRIPAGATFDAVIASEVMEHVEEPLQFLGHLKTLLGNNSVLIVTLPNGYGCHEIMSAAEALLQVSGFIPALKILRNLFRKGPKTAPSQDTLAISPHINFFSHGAIRKIFRDLGFDVAEYKGRMFLYNFIVSMVIDKSDALVRWNIDMGRKLPPRWVADWMFVLRPVSQTRNGEKYKRNIYEKLKLRLNYTRLGLSVPPRLVE